MQYYYDMNKLSRSVLNVLEKSPMGEMSIHYLVKQCKDAHIDYARIAPSDLPALREKFQETLKFFVGYRDKEILLEIDKMIEEGNVR